MTLTISITTENIRQIYSDVLSGSGRLQSEPFLRGLLRSAETANEHNLEEGQLLAQMFCDLHSAEHADWSDDPELFWQEDDKERIPAKGGRQ